MVCRTDAKLHAVLEGLSDETIHTQMIKRPFFETPLMVHFHIYREALLIFYAKATCYLHGMVKSIVIALSLLMACNLL